MPRNPVSAGIRRLASLALMASVFCVQTASAAERIPDDTYIGQQWHLFKIGATQAWTSTLGFEGVTIAIIDSGVDIDHPDLKENIWRNVKEIAGNGIDDDRNGYIDDIHGWDFVSNDNDPRPDVSGSYDVLGANHGTVDAGVAAARGGNGKGIAGVAWQATIMPLRALNSDGSGSPEDVVRAIEYAMHNGAKIINLSFAGPSYRPELAIAVRRAYDAGVFVVAAAGNAPQGGEPVDLDKTPLYPICLDRESDENFIYGVVATDENDGLAPFSNYGAACADISAPGSRIISTQLQVPGNPDFALPYGGYYNGTSLAAAEVSGVVALIKSLDYNLTPKQIMNILTQSSVNIDAKNREHFGKYGRGRIDAAAAVELTLASRRQARGPEAVPTSTLLPAGTQGSVIVTASGPGRATELRMFTQDGTFIRSFSAFAEGFRGGASVAVADFDGRRQTIVAGALAGGSPQVRIFDINSRLLGSFLAYDGQFRGGVSVATGDLDGDGKDEIITGAGPGGGPHVRAFSSGGVPVGGFFAFDAKTRTGVEIAVADLDGDRKAEIVAWTNGGTSIRIFSGKGDLIRTLNAPAKLLGVTLTDVNEDGVSDILARLTATKTVPAMRAYRYDGAVLADMDADGHRAGTGTFSRSPIRNVVFGSPSKTSAVVSVFDPRGVLLRFTGYEPSFKGGVNAARTE